VLFGGALGAGVDFTHDLHAGSAAVLNGFISIPISISPPTSKSTTLGFPSSLGVLLLADFNDDAVSRCPRWCDFLAKIASKHISSLSELATCVLDLRLGSADDRNRPEPLFGADATSRSQSGTLQQSEGPINTKPETTQKKARLETRIPLDRYKHMFDGPN
jgi:hypothetical protein